MATQRQRYRHGRKLATLTGCFTWNVEQCRGGGDTGLVLVSREQISVFPGGSRKPSEAQTAKKVKAGRLLGGCFPQDEKNGKILPWRLDDLCFKPKLVQQGVLFALFQFIRCPEPFIQDEQPIFPYHIAQ